MEEQHDTPEHLGDGNVRLAWVIVHGEERHVREFTGLPRKDLPPASCPVCGEPVVLHLKLGKRAQHAAHRPGVKCVATAPETALHLNAKFHLLAVLRAASKIQLREQCHGPRCDRARPQPRVIEGWDTVEVERRVGTLRPDLTLLRDGEAIAALEVFATHAVDAVKEKALADEGLPWVEVRAADVLGDQQWTSTMPLPVHRHGPELPWRCGGCRLKLQALEREEAKRKADIEFAQANGIHRRFARLVDLYYSSGKKWRVLVEIVEEKRGGAVVAVHLSTWTRDQTARFEGTGQENRERLLAEFEAWVRDWKRRGAVLVDVLTDWSGKVHELFAELTAGDYWASRYPHRYAWNGREWCKRIADQRNDLSGPGSSRRSAGWLFPIEELGSRPDPFAS